MLVLVPIHILDQAACEFDRVVLKQRLPLDCPRAVRDLRVERLGQQGQVAEVVDMRLSVLLLLGGLDRPVVLPLLREEVLDRETRALDLRLTCLGPVGVLDRLQECAQAGAGKSPVGRLRQERGANLVVARPVGAGDVQPREMCRSRARRAPTQAHRSAP